MHPANARRLATGAPSPARPGGPALPDTDVLLDRDAVVALLTARLTEDLRRLVPETRGVGVTQSWRVTDGKRGRPYALSNVLALLADLACDPRIPASDVCALLEGLALELRALKGELADAPELWDAHEVEECANDECNRAARVALRTRQPGALIALMAQYDRQIAASVRGKLAAQAEYDRLTRPRAA